MNQIAKYGINYPEGLLSNIRSIEFRDLMRIISKTKADQLGRIYKRITKSQNNEVISVLGTQVEGIIGFNHDHFSLASLQFLDFR